MRFKGGAALLGLVGLALCGCASEETQRLAREPSIPPVVVTRAATEGRYWKNVTIQEVQGAPEFRWFDGDAILTTRPTRVQALRVFTDDLEKVGMRSSSRVDSEYMLYVKFEDLHGPDMVPFSDKHATAAITFRMVEWRTGRVIKSKRVIAEYSSDLGGIMPETGRLAAFEAVGYAVGGVVGQLELAPLALANDRAIPSDEEAADLFFHYRLLGQKSSPMSEVAEVGPVNGTARRIAAWHGLLNLAFDQFMNELSSDGSVVFKRAVSCDAFGGYAPAGFSSARANAQMVETANTYAVDCPGSNYLESPTHRLYPSRF